MLQPPFGTCLICSRSGPAIDETGAHDLDGILLDSAVTDSDEARGNNSV